MDEQGSAAVRIAMTVGAAGRSDGVLLALVDEQGAPERIIFDQRVGQISATLVIGDDVKSATPLKSNDRICSPGVKTFGAGFILSAQEAEIWRIKASLADTDFLHPYYGGKDLTERWRGKFVIDVDAMDELQMKLSHPFIYSYLFNNVKPERDENNDTDRQENWWRFGRRNTELRDALSGCSRFIATTETAKHRLFCFLDRGQFPEGGLVVIADQWVRSNQIGTGRRAVTDSGRYERSVTDIYIYIYGSR